MTARWAGLRLSTWLPGLPARSHHLPPHLVNTPLACQCQEPRGLGAPCETESCCARKAVGLGAGRPDGGGRMAVWSVENSRALGCALAGPLSEDRGSRPLWWRSVPGPPGSCPAPSPGARLAPLPARWHPLVTLQRGLRSCGGVGGATQDTRGGRAFLGVSVTPWMQPSGAGCPPPGRRQCSH